MPFKIAIIGAGPAGTMIARLLQQSKEQISVTIFESEGSIDFRSQGGSLDLHEKDGQAALKAAGLFVEFQKHARYDGEAMTISDKNLLFYLKQSASQKSAIAGRPEIDRPKLRELLYNSLAEGTVQWNHKLMSVGEDRSLHFANGTTLKDFDLIIGADGGWSKVRPRLSSVQPYYSGIAGHAFRIPDAEKNAPEQYRLVNRGSFFSYSDGKSILSQQMGDGSINIGTWSVRPEHWQKEYDVHDAAAVKEACRKEYADWDPRIVAFTQEAEDDVAPRDLYMLPIGHRWEHVPGVTLVGDAAHLMTPFAGEGVNLAFEDSLKLTNAIISASAAAGAAQEQDRMAAQKEARTALDKNVAEFEQDMFARATKTQQLTYDMMNMKYMVAGGPRSTIEPYILRAMENGMGYWVTKLLLTPLVYAYFGVFKMLW